MQSVVWLQRARAHVSFICAWIRRCELSSCIALHHLSPSARSRCRRMYLRLHGPSFLSDETCKPKHILWQPRSGPEVIFRGEIWTRSPCLESPAAEVRSGRRHRDSYLQIPEYQNLSVFASRIFFSSGSGFMMWCLTNKIPLVCFML